MHSAFPLGKETLLVHLILIARNTDISLMQVLVMNNSPSQERLISHLHARVLNNSHSSRDVWNEFSSRLDSSLQLCHTWNYSRFLTMPLPSDIFRLTVGGMCTASKHTKHTILKEFENYPNRWVQGRSQGVWQGVFFPNTSVTWPFTYHYLPNPGQNWLCIFAKLHNTQE